jgi:hypothetical protein
VPPRETPRVIADGDLAAIVERAAELGIPAWRVTTALGLAPDDAGQQTPDPSRDRSN